MDDIRSQNAGGNARTIKHRSMPTFSIVVPLYNTKGYIAETLRSIAQQTCADFEAIIVDDGSTDGSGKITEEFSRRDPRFRYVKQTNAGVSAARNAGIELASGEFLYYVDSDDRIAPHTLSAAWAPGKVIRFVNMCPQGDANPCYRRVKR